MQDDLITDEGSRKIGKAIYTEALSDRRGFRSDQIGIPDDDHEVWNEIYDSLGRAALAAALPLIRAGVAAAPMTGTEVLFADVAKRQDDAAARIKAKARAEAIEECAKVADDMGREEQTNTRDVDALMQACAREEMGYEIAAAIRKLGAGDG
jgi:hypothetical protein